MSNNNFNSPFGNNGNQSGYKPFSSSNSRQSNGFNQTPAPMSRQNNNSFGNNNQGFGNNSSFGNQSSFIGQSNNQNPFASNNRGSSFGGSNYNNNSSFGNMNNNQNPFASNNRNSSFGNSSFSNQRSSGFGSQYNMNSSFGQSNQRGYSLMNSPFSTRPDSMNRPISVYGKSTGFYFPRENDTVTFNEQNSQILTPPEHLEQNNYQEQYEEQQQDYSSYDDNTYQDNQYEEQSYDQNYGDYQDQYQNQYNEDQNAYNDEVQDPNQFTADNAGGNLISRMARDLKELEMQSNANIPRGVILATREGDIIGQGYNYVDENNDEYEGEEYAIIGDLAEGGAANCVIYATSAPNKKVHDLILASGVKEVLIIASDSKERKQLSKDKDYKKSEKALTKKGINVEIIVDGE